MRLSTSTPCAGSGLGLYVHIPFCRARCRYCDFNSYAGLETLKPRYVAALSEEVRRWGQALHGPAVTTLYIGGGTPSVLSGDEWRCLLSSCRQSFDVAADAEVTCEANPGTVSQTSLNELRRLGVNRLSLGVQSFDDRELRELGRIHSAAEAVEALGMARAAGFDNASIDLLYGLPWQSLEGWRASLERAVALAPQHISAYALTVEEDTPLARAVAAGEVPTPDPDMAADMYLLAEELLAAAGYEHYEISNWAKPGYRCRHNLGYWNNRPYLGFGAGAHSCWGGYRFWTMASPGEYIARMDCAAPVAVAEPAAEQLIAGIAAVDGKEAIDRQLELAETMILGLRLVEGIELDEVDRRFDVDTVALYGPQIEELVCLGLLELEGGRLRLTARGRLLGNQVFLRFLPQS